MDIEMRVRGLVVDPMSKMPIVLLEDTASDRVLPIWIGVFEANAIALVMENIDTPRPMTHDLFKNMLEKAGIIIDKVVVNDVQNNTFYALIHCQHEGRKIVIDSRPSDAIALALRMKSPIFVRDEVVKLSHSLKLDENLETSEKIMKWLESLRPEDLGKYKM
ncbi:MAG: hypothetical protein A2Y86_04875 [Candidatus Aminicenantes bacterium RBG_13_62_12]|nr:MAG: hypothetical protein A2Y86_04875 [Candidatus Aminicenantes bacterium RBG_13_62_12]